MVAFGERELDRERGDGCVVESQLRQFEKEMRGGAARRSG